VRDELLGLAPTDYDVATDAPPQRIKSLFKRTAEVGAAFGVVLVTPGKDEGAADQATVEVATFRSDGPYSDSRRPDAVTFSTPEADARRRDFTVNALFLDPLDVATAGAGGRVIDLVGGEADLRRRVIRAVGDPEERLAEDHLRALRAVRFAARLGFELDPTTGAAIRAHTRELRGVSRERIGDEMRKVLAHGSRARAVAMLEELGLDAPVLEEPTQQSDLRLMRGLPNEGATLAHALAAWALDRGLGITGPAAGGGSAAARVAARYRKALCLSNEERDRLVGILAAMAAIEGVWDAAGVALQKRIAGSGPDFGAAISLFAVRSPQRAAAIRARVADLAASAGGLTPGPLVNGDDLIAEGLKPGRSFKVLLERVYDAQLEGRVTTKTEAIAAARELERSLGV
jgi:poly(A) polymerase